MVQGTPSALPDDELPNTARPAEAGGFVPITEPLNAAFEIGRQLNRLSFHLQQAWFFAGDYHQKAAEEAMNSFRRAYAVLLPVSQRERAQRCISARIEGLIQALKEEAHAEELTRINLDLNQLAGRGELGDHPSEHRREVLQPVFAVLESFRALLQAGVDNQPGLSPAVQNLIDEGACPPTPRLDDRMLLAWRLGELIDQGLCPPEISRHLTPVADSECPTRKPEEHRPARKPKEHPPGGVGFWRPVGARPVSVEKLIARKSYAPGDRLPPDGWLDDVRQLWAQVPIPLSFPVAVLHKAGAGDESAESAEERREAIARFAQKAHEGLRALTGARAGPVIAAASEPVADPPPMATATAHPGPAPAPSARPCVPVANVAHTSPDGRRRFQELLAQKRKMDPEGKYVGESLPILKVFDQIADFNKTSSAPVLLRGPTGVGKTEIAKLIHRTSDRKGKPFRREQASDNKGADMHIVKGRWVGYGENSGITSIPKNGLNGILQECAGGTVFVDEITETTREFQTFLLDVIDGQLIPLTAGKGPPVKAEVRLIAATNEDPEEAVQARRLKGDLWRRLRSRQVDIPPLADRRSDIFLFVSALCGERRPELGFFLALLRYGWPGNVGELRDVLQAAVRRADLGKGPLTVDHHNFADSSIVESIRQMSEDSVTREVLTELSTMLREQGLEKGRGLQKRMAELLCVSDATVTRMLKGLGEQP